MRLIYRGLGGATLALLLVTVAAAQREIPSDRLLRSLQATADVNDFAGILSDSQKASLEARCQELREKTGAQLAVVTLKSLEGGQVDDFTVKLFKRWGVGQKEKNNGILLLVAIADRKARIEVGYGLEPILPDALSGRILREQLFPAFREQRYFDGLLAAVNRIVEVVQRNEPAPAPPPHRHAANWNYAIGVGLIFIFVGASLLGTGLRDRQTTAILFGGLGLAATILICGYLRFPWAPLVHVPAAVLLTLLAWFGQDRDRTGRRRRRSSGWSGWDFGPAGGWSSSNWSGGGFSGGGFSSSGGSWGGFGGGSSGGGGASRGW